MYVGLVHYIFWNENLKNNLPPSPLLGEILCEKTSTTYIGLILLQTKNGRPRFHFTLDITLGTAFTINTIIHDFGQYYRNFLSVLSSKQNSLIIPYS